MYSKHSSDYLDASRADSKMELSDVRKKVICLPLGVKHKRNIHNDATAFKESRLQKTRILVINNSGWGDRTAVNEHVSRAFNYTVFNSYSNKGVMLGAKHAHKGLQERSERSERSERRRKSERTKMMAWTMCCC